MKKRITALLLSVILCIGLLGTMAFAAADAENAYVEDGAIVVPGAGESKVEGSTVLVPVTDQNGVTNFLPGTVNEAGDVVVDIDDNGLVTDDISQIGGMDIGEKPADPSPSPEQPSPSPEPSPSPNPNPGGGWYPSTPSTPSNPSYTVGNNSGSSANGSWSTDKSSAKKGDTVTITVRPNEGYQGTPVVKDANGNNVSVSSLGNNKYSFVMPDGRVTISAEFTPVSVAPANPFTDVRQGDYFYDAVLWAVENGITNGTSATQFSPNQTCTRAQTVTFLWRAAGSPAPKSTTNPFTDVAPGAYYYDAVLWAVENGITNGTGANTFSPDATVTRGQTVTFQYRAAKAQAATGNNPFVDVKAGEYYADAVQWAVNNGITNGTSATTFSPNEGCTRGQIVTFLFRAK